MSTHTDSMNVPVQPPAWAVEEAARLLREHNAQVARERAYYANGGPERVAAERREREAAYYLWMRRK